MANPKVTQSFLDGQVGVRALANGDIPLLIGCSSSGTVNIPTKYGGGRQAQILADYGYGPMPQLAALLSSLGVTVVVCKTTSTTPGSQSAVVFSGTGTSVITTTGASRDDYEVFFKVVAGGTIGVAGITFQYSLDNGRTFSQIIALGTANNYLLPNTGITLAFAAGTLVAADTAKFLGTAPKWGTSDITSAFTAAYASLLVWDFACITGPCSATEAATVKTQMTAAEAGYRYTSTLVETVRQTAAQSDSAWQAVIVPDWAAFSGSRIVSCAGLDKLSSPLDGFNYLRPSMWEACIRACLVDAAIDLARVLDGPLLGSIVDSQLNLVAHDERSQPGLDDARFLTLTSIIGETGVFITNPKTMAPAGSDFDLWQFRRVMDKAAAATYAALRKLLSSGVRVDKKTGFILEKDALAIEQIVNSALRDEIMSKGRASAAYFILSRTDNILSTRTLTGKTRIVPLGYIKTLVNELAFENPALKVL